MIDIYKIDFRKYDGKRFECYHRGIFIKGVIRILSRHVVLYNNCTGTGTWDKQANNEGYAFGFSACLLHDDGTPMSDFFRKNFENFRIMSKFKNDKDFANVEEGDFVIINGEKQKVLGKVGGVVFFTKTGRNNPSASDPISYSIEYLISDKNAFMFIDICQEDELKKTEITMDEVAKKFGIPVDQLLIKKED